LLGDVGIGKTLYQYLIDGFFLRSRSLGLRFFSSEKGELFWPLSYALFHSRIYNHPPAIRDIAGQTEPLW
jgi:hypothetical protein